MATDALENLLRMYHGLSRFLKLWTIGTKDRDSVTEALNTTTVEMFDNILRISQVSGYRTTPKSVPLFLCSRRSKFHEKL